MTLRFSNARTPSEHGGSDRGFHRGLAARTGESPPAPDVAQRLLYVILRSAALRGPGTASPMFIAFNGSVGRVASLMLALVLGEGCSSRDSGSAAVSQAPSDATGVLSADLTFQGGEHVSTVSWTLANSLHSYSGTVNVSNASTIGFVIGNVAAGDNYT